MQDIYENETLTKDEIKLQEKLYKKELMTNMLDVYKNKLGEYFVLDKEIFCHTIDISLDRNNDVILTYEYYDGKTKSYHNKSSQKLSINFTNRLTVLLYDDTVIRNIIKAGKMYSFTGYNLDRIMKHIKKGDIARVMEISKHMEDLYG